MTRAQNCKQSPSEIEGTGTFASVFDRVQAKKIRAFRCSATLQKNVSFPTRGAYGNQCRHDLTDWQTNAMTLPKKMATYQSKKIIPNFIGRDSAELNQSSNSGFFSYLDRLSFPIAIEIN